MNELELLRWYENPKDPECYEEDMPVCRWCRQPDGECECIDDWKVID